MNPFIYILGYYPGLLPGLGKLSYINYYLLLIRPHYIKHLIGFNNNVYNSPD
ncbi:hypothetical protein HanIR_Chr07g0316751 [Helianthus annuus]|nr:hypothetical protein HanIR_Chr07g0316751 [Helianthus annuus]